MPTQFTDMLDRPITVGARIAYPSASGSSAAEMNLGEIIAIDEIIPNNPGDPSDCRGYYHSDRNKPDPTRRRIISRSVRDPNGRYGWRFERIDAKAYSLQLHRVNFVDGEFVVDDERKIRVKNVDRIVVVD